MTSLHDIFVAAGATLHPDGRLENLDKPFRPEPFDIRLRVVPVGWEIKFGEPHVVTFSVVLNDTATINGDRLAYFYWDKELTLPLEQVQILPSGDARANISRQS